MLGKLFSVHGTRGINIFSLPADGSRMIQKRNGTNIRYLPFFFSLFILILFNVMCCIYICLSLYNAIFLIILQYVLNSLLYLLILVAGQFY